MKAMAKRIVRLEGRAASAVSGAWHRLIWEVGQSWDDLLTSYGPERIGPEDNIILREVVDAEDGRPVPDPIRERDKPQADAWFAAREPRCNSAKRGAEP